MSKEVGPIKSQKAELAKRDSTVVQRPTVLSSQRSLPAGQDSRAWSEHHGQQQENAAHQWSRGLQPASDSYTPDSDYARTTQATQNPYRLQVHHALVLKPFNT